MYKDKNLVFARANKNYKDTIFRMLFKDKMNLLELYNAINSTNYDNPDDLEIVTLENAIYMSMKNDVSCIIDLTLQLFEHQSTFNPNMPVRVLIYVTEQIKILFEKKNMYSKTLIKIPTPSFFVLYNGVEEQPEVRELKLSDAFKVQVDRPSLEVIVTQYNINPGYNRSLMAKCPTLMEYMLYVDRVRTHQKECMSLDEAVDLAIDECIRENILRDFLTKHRAEVKNMFLYEYDEELHKKFIREEGYDEGFAAGEDSGIRKANIESARNLKLTGVDINIIAKATGLTVEEVEAL